MEKSKKRLRAKVVNKKTEETVMDNEIPIRYNVPTKYDSAPYATIIKVITGMGDEEIYQFYIQISKKEAEPEWVQMGEFLEMALEDFFHDNEFISESLLAYENMNIN